MLARTVAAGPPRVKEFRFWYNGRVAASPRQSSQRPSLLRLAARPGRLAAINGTGFVFGTALLVAMRLIPQLLSPLAFWLLLAALAAAFAGDFLWWHLHGTRSVELDGDTLTMRIGRLREPRRIERSSVRGVSSRRRWGGKALVISLRARGPRGTRVRLRDDAFDPVEFSALSERLSAWGQRPARA